MSENAKACLAEFIATFGLVFIGVGSIIIDAHTNGGVGLLSIAMAHGLAISIGVCAIGHISGGHINPAVTIAMLITKRIGIGLGIAYVAFQILGAIAGAWILKVTFPADAVAAATLGTPMLAAGVSTQAGIAIEAVLTFFLIFAIFGSAVDPRGPKGVAGFVIGLAVAMDILAGGPLTGAAMNPARYVGPALLSGQWANCSVYWIGPILGAVVAGLVYEKLLLKR